MVKKVKDENPAKDHRSEIGGALSNEQAELASILPLYYEIKQNQAKLKKDEEAMNAKIKELCKAAGVEESEINGFKISCKTIQIKSFNEEKIIALLKEQGAEKGIVKKKEYLDTEAFESAIYNKISPSGVKLKVTDFADCEEVKEQVRLQVKK